MNGYEIMVNIVVGVVATIMVTFALSVLFAKLRLEERWIRPFEMQNTPRGTHWAIKHNKDRRGKFLTIYLYADDTGQVLGGTNISMASDMTYAKTIKAGQDRVLNSAGLGKRRKRWILWG